MKFTKRNETTAPQSVAICEIEFDAAGLNEVKTAAIDVLEACHEMTRQYDEAERGHEIELLKLNPSYAMARLERSTEADLAESGSVAAILAAILAPLGPPAGPTANAEAANGQSAAARFRDAAKMARATAHVVREDSADKIAELMAKSAEYERKANEYEQGTNETGCTAR